MKEEGQNPPEVIVISDDEEEEVDMVHMDIDHVVNQDLSNLTILHSDHQIPRNQTGIVINHDTPNDDNQLSKKRRRNENDDKGKGKAIVIEIDSDSDDEYRGLQRLSPTPEMLEEFDHAVQGLLQLCNERDGTLDLINQLDFSLGESSNHNPVILPESELAPKTPHENDLFEARRQAFRLTEELRIENNHSEARRHAFKLAEEVRKQKKENSSGVELKTPNSKNPSRFYDALEMIRKREEQRIKAKEKGIINWFHNSNRGVNKSKKAPSLVDISLDLLAKHSEKIVSLEIVPDELKHKLSQAVSDSRKLDAHFAGLLTKGSPTEIRVKDGSYLNEEELKQIFSDFDAKRLTLLQLDLSGNALSDRGMKTIIIQSAGILRSLVSVSLRCAYRLTDSGLKSLAESAPALQSLNLRECCLITSEGINLLAFGHRLNMKELYLDDCENINAMLILPALKEFKNLEVLSVAGISTVCDDFVIELVEAHGRNIKELGLAQCGALTDKSMEAVGRYCSELRALDLSYLYNLTDCVMQFLADGCSSIRRLKLCRNIFSDEAVASFLEAAGQNLTELLLNHVQQVGPNTALALARCSRNLSTLDISFCRELTDEAIGLIVDSCSLLKLLKVFGCTQITNHFILGHSNSDIQIMGLKLRPLVFQLLVKTQPTC